MLLSSVGGLKIYHTQLPNDRSLLKSTENHRSRAFSKNFTYMQVSAPAQRFNR